MTLTQLHYFQTLAEILNYTKTAEMLHISQPSLSYAIAKLENDLGVPLFSKKNRQVSLTPYGDFFLTYVNHALATLEEGTRMTRQMMLDPAGGAVTLGYFYSIASDFIPSIVESIHKKHPDFEITFHFTQHMNNDLLTELKAGRIDLAFCVTADSDVECAKIAEQMLYAVVPNGHRLAKQKAVSVHDLASEKMVLLHKNSSLRATVEGLFFDAGVPLHIAYETQECNGALQFVSIGGCVSIMPQVPAMQLQPVTALPISDRLMKRSIFLAWNKREILSPAVRQVRDFILSEWSDPSIEHLEVLPTHIQHPIQDQIN